MNPSKWTKTEDKILISLYSDTRILDLLPLLPGRTWSAINRHAQRLNLKSNPKVKRRYCVNDRFFEHPNILNSYWAGFIAADGCVYSQNNNLEISIHVNDIEHLQQFVKDIEYNGKIQIYGNIARVCICGRNTIIDDLRKYFNITPRKSLTLKPPQFLDFDCSVAYMVGYIDGDGCIFKKEKYDGIHVTGTKDVLEYIKSICHKIAKSPSHCPIAKVRHGHLKDKKSSYLGKKYTFVYSIVGSQATAIIKYCNQFDIPKLARKWQKKN